jgi:hypothetical protein
MAEHSAVNRRVVGSSPTCGAKIGRRSSGLTLAAFSFCQAVFVTASRSNGWRNIEPIFVELIKTVLNLAVLYVEWRDRLIPESLLVCVALM